MTLRTRANTTDTPRTALAVTSQREGFDSDRRMGRVVGHRQGRDAVATDIVIAQTTIDNEESARELAQKAVSARLAACAHIDAPLTAVYRWKQNIEMATEWRVSFKTTQSRLPALAEWVGREHSYDVPEWIVLPVAGASDAYLAWVIEETTASEISTLLAPRGALG